MHTFTVTWLHILDGVPHHFSRTAGYTVFPCFILTLTQLTRAFRCFKTRFVPYALDTTFEVIQTEYGQRIHKHPEAGYIQLASQHKYINDEG